MKREDESTEWLAKKGDTMGSRRGCLGMRGENGSYGGEVDACVDREEGAFLPVGGSRADEECSGIIL